MTSFRDSIGKVVIVGGGLAAVRTAQALRALGHEGTIVMLSDEVEMPYDRPPLSKQVLLGTFPEEALRLLDEEECQRLGIDLRLGHRVVALDPDARMVRVDGHDDLVYDALVVATGSRPRRLDAVADAPDVHYVRTLDDARGLAGRLHEGARVVVVGAGFIGLEVASCARSLGADVTVVEAAPQPLRHALGSEIAAWLQEWHTERGVRFHCGVTVTASTPGSPGARLQLSDGRMLPADVVVVGVGVERDTTWLREAGLEVEGGLVCDEDGRTATPGVFGAGDVVYRVGPSSAALIGHWTAASGSAERVARALLGLESPSADDDAYFWSHQGDLRLQAVGRHRLDATTTVVSGELATGSFVAHYVLDGELVGVVAANSARTFLLSRKVLREQDARSASVR